MRGSLDLLEQVGHAVEAQARPKVAEIAGHDPERLLAPPGGLDGKSAPQRVVHDIPEGTTEATRIRLQLRRDVVIKGECGAHI